MIEAYCNSDRALLFSLAQSTALYIEVLDVLSCDTRELNELDWVMVDCE
jgi:hypothetical protein